MTEKHRNVATNIFLEGGWTQKKKSIRYWMVGYQSVSSMPDGGRLSGMARSEARYSRSFQEAGAKRRQRRRKMEMAKRYRRTPFLKANGTEVTSE